MFAFVSAPIDMAHHLPPNPTLTVSSSTSSVPKEEPRLQRASRATRRCNRSSKPPTSLKPVSCQRPWTHLLSHLIHAVPRFTVSWTMTSATTTNRRSKTPRAAASTSSSSRRSRCAMPAMQPQPCLHPHTSQRVHPYNPPTASSRASLIPPPALAHAALKRRPGRQHLAHILARRARRRQPSATA